ncbi:MAG: hypothetical protein Q4B70_17665 [Lachnospiraceae bacterium]|nr:hypothetical protein [Lachnospiraceae bacterium]
MNTKRKVDIVMNLMYNLVLAVLFSLIAEAINAGGVTWPAIAVDTGVSYVLEMIIAIFLPFTLWGQRVALKYAKPGSKKFRIICTGITAIPFATLMSLAMSFISCVLMLHLPFIVFFMAWMRIWILFIVIAWVCSYLFIPVFIELAKKILKIPAEYNPFEE